jgi:hypothetical protein
MNYQDIKTVEDAFKAVGVDINKLPDFSMAPTEDQKALEDHYKMIIVAKALNGDWKPNWQDDDEYKYFPYFDMEAGLVFYAYYCYFTYSHVGSRLCFHSSEIVEHLVAQPEFFELYKNYFTYAAN